MLNAALDKFAGALGSGCAWLLVIAGGAWAYYWITGRNLLDAVLTLLTKCLA